MFYEVLDAFCLTVLYFVVSEQSGTKGIKTYVGESAEVITECLGNRPEIYNLL